MIFTFRFINYNISFFLIYIILLLLIISFLGNIINRR